MVVAVDIAVVDHRALMELANKGVIADAASMGKWFSIRQKSR
jgi:hypothetical protein